LLSWLCRLDRRLQIPKHLHSRRLGVTVEDRIDVLHDVGAHIEEITLVLDWDTEGLWC